MLSSLRRIRRLLKWRKRKRHFFVQLNEREALGVREQEIPPTVFQTASTRLVDDEQLEEIQRYRAMNPNLAFLFFDDEQMELYMRENWRQHPIWDLYQRSRFPQVKTDLFRYCLILDRGGYWLDINKGIFSDFSAFHQPSDHGLIAYERNDAVIFPDSAVARLMREPHKIVIQWAFGFCPGHPIMREAIEQVVEHAPWFDGVTFKHVREAVFAFSGPGLFTKVVRNYLRDNGAAGLAQAGVDWDGTSMFRLRGSHRRPAKPPHYASAKSQTILGGAV